MRAFFVFLLLLFTVNPIFAADWELYWADEFNYTGLPDQTHWNYEGGFTRNEELQYYMRNRKENARVENGFLIIEAREETIQNPGYKRHSMKWRENRPTAEYTSASLITLNKVSFMYGRIEVRAKLPHGMGVWPAIWTLGENMSEVGYPKCGEIDILEYYGKIPNQVFANIHFDKNGKRKSGNGKLDFQMPFDDFHIYAIEWSKEKIDFYFDKFKYFTFNLDTAGTGSENPFRKPHYLLINLALGGAPGGNIDNDNLPQKFVIDYVRYFTRKGDKY